MDKSNLDTVIKKLRNAPTTKKIEIELEYLEADDKIYVANMLQSEIVTKIAEGKQKYNPKIITTLRDIVNKSNDELKDLATKDPLTKLHNREQLHQIFKTEQYRMSRDQNYKFSILIMDIDHFKKFNDTYGHNAGDEVLKNFSKIITQNIRGTDGAFRYGGEEFIIIYSGTSDKEAHRAAKLLKTCIENNKMIFIDNKGKSHEKTITFSGGVTEVKKDESIKTAIERADKLLYAVKKKGRNDVLYKISKN